METKLEQIAAKARCEPKLRFTSLAHHITRERILRSLTQIPKRSAPGVDGQTVEQAVKTFGGWVEPMLQSINRRGYRAPDIQRVYPQARPAGEVPSRRSDRMRPGPPAQHGPGPFCHLRAGFSALLVRRKAGYGASIWMRLRIASPETLPDADPVASPNCSLKGGVREASDEDGQHGDAGRSFCSSGRPL